MKLYKYIPENFTHDFLKKGRIMFRNLTYFRQYEGVRRGDQLEGFHQDNPDNDITLTNQRNGKVIKGDFSFLNSTNTDLIFVFCLSMEHKESLYNEFETNICIEITDSDEFVKRTKFAVKKLLSAHEFGLLCGPVNYYKHNAHCEFDIKDPKKLAFSKNIHYAHQDEFRLAFGTTKKAFNLKQQIVVNKSYDFLKDAMNGRPKDKLLTIGNLQDITKIHRM